MSVETQGQWAIALLFLSFLAILGVMAFLLWYAYYREKRRGSRCPYTKKDLLLGIDMAKSMQKYINQFLEQLNSEENPPIDFARAAISYETGRIFTNCVGRGEHIHIDWNFLEKKYPGKWISWGSLNDFQRGTIQVCQVAIENYQTAHSSSRVFPRDIEPEFAIRRPGPLYVDLTTKILLGWQVVPGTDFEVLIVQKPKYESIDDTL